MENNTPYYAGYYSYKEMEDYANANDLMILIHKKDYYTLTPIQPSKTIFSKLEIVEAFTKVGKIDVLEQLLADKTFNLYWISANEIDLNHTITANAIQQLDNNGVDITSKDIIKLITKP